METISLAENNGTATEPDMYAVPRQGSQCPGLVVVVNCLVSGCGFKVFVRMALSNEGALPKIHKVNMRPEKHITTVPINITNCTIIACSELFVARYEVRRVLVGLWRRTE